MEVVYESPYLAATGRTGGSKSLAREAEVENLVANAATQPARKLYSIAESAIAAREVKDPGIS